MNGNFTQVSRTRLITTPADYSGNACTAEYISLKGYTKVRFIVISGAWAGSSSAISFLQATDVAASGAKALGFDYMYTNDGSPTSDTLVKTAVTSNTFNVDTASSIYVVEIDASMLDMANGFDCVAIVAASPGVNSDFYCIIAEAYDGRYADNLSCIVD